MAERSNTTRAEESKGQRARRPQRASRDYLGSILKDTCLVPGVPADVADAVFGLLLDRRLLKKAGRDNFELGGTPGATTDLPERAGAAIHKSLLAMLRQDKALDVVAHVVRGSGASGSGAGLGGASSRNLEQQIAESDAAYLRELEWNADSVIEAMGPGVSNEAAVIVEHVLRDLRKGGKRKPGRSQVPASRRTVAGTSRKRSSLKPLPDRIRSVYDMLCSLPEGAARNSQQISDALSKRGVHMSSEHVRKLVMKHRKELRIKTRLGAGYYILLEDRQKSQ